MFFQFTRRVQLMTGKVIDQSIQFVANRLISIGLSQSSHTQL